MSLIINFGKRHKKKLIFSALFFGGGYLTVQYTIKKFKETLFLSSKAALLANKKFLSLRKYEHFLSVKKTSDEAVIEYIKTIQEEINKMLSCEEILEQLKQKPSNKLELWEKMKIRCVSKCLSTIYSIAIFSLFAKIELSIIGAYLFTNNSYESSFESCLELLNNPNLKLSPSVQQKYLENIEKFVKEGLVNLCQKIHECCEQILGNVNLKENIDIDFLNQKIELIKQKLQVEKFILDYINLEQLGSDLLIVKPSTSTSNSKTDDEVLKDLNLETLDLLNSEDFNFTFQSLVDFLKNEFLNNLTSLMVKQIMTTDNSDRISISLPFAKIIPILDKTQFLFDTNTSIFYNLLNDLKLNIFSANIYEAFSNLPESESPNELNEFASLDLNLLIKNLI